MYNQYFVGWAGVLYCEKTIARYGIYDDKWHCAMDWC